MPNDCQCQVCRDACAFKPGWFMPGEAERLAAAMGVTLQELFDQHLQADYWVGGHNIFVLSPRIVGAKGGSIFDFAGIGRCHWFVDGKCAIHDLGKPHECRAMHHTNKTGDGSLTHEEVAMAWNRPEHQAQIVSLLG